MYNIYLNTICTQLKKILQQRDNEILPKYKIHVENKYTKTKTRGKESTIFKNKITLYLF